MRTDVQLRRDVIDEMSGESTLRVDQIGVEVRDGIVFLTGQVDNFAERSAAEEAAYRATGLRAMAMGLSIKRSCPARSDETWASEVRRSREHDPNKIHRASN